MQLLHKPTGIRVECQETRSLKQNRKIARKLLLEKVRRLDVLIHIRAEDCHSWIGYITPDCRNKNCSRLSKSRENVGAGRKLKSKRKDVPQEERTEMMMTRHLDYICYTETPRAGILDSHGGHSATSFTLPLARGMYGPWSATVFAIFHASIPKSGYISHNCTLDDSSSLICPCIWYWCDPRESYLRTPLTTYWSKTRAPFGK